MNTTQTLLVTAILLALLGAALFTPPNSLENRASSSRDVSYEHVNPLNFDTGSRTAAKAENSDLSGNQIVGRQ